MTLRDLLAADAARMCSADQFGEQVTYYPEGRKFDPITVTCVVNRRGDNSVAVGAEAQVIVFDVTLEMPRDAIPDRPRPGVVIAEIVMPDGKRPEQFRLKEVIDSDPGMWVLGFER